MPSTKRPTQHFDLCEVWWDDASEMDHGWADEVKTPEPAMVISAGFLILKNKDHVVLALDADEQGMHNGRGQIPMGMVRHIKVLRKADKASD